MILFLRLEKDRFCYPDFIYDAELRNGGVAAQKMAVINIAEARHQAQIAPITNGSKNVR